MNGGLSNELKEAFPYNIPVKKEERINNYNILASAKERVAVFSTDNLISLLLFKNRKLKVV